MISETAQHPVRNKSFRSIKERLLKRLDDWIDSRWEVRHGVDTGGVTQLRELDIQNGSANLGFEYRPSTVRMIRWSLQHLPQTDGATFIDYGSGKGRVLLVAAEYPFRRIMGVEYARELHETAVQNLVKYSNPRQRCHRIEAVLGDASKFPIPDENCVLYLYTPFKGQLLQQVLDNIVESHDRNPRSMYVVYTYQTPYHLAMFQAMRGFRAIPPRNRTWCNQTFWRPGVCVYASEHAW